MMLWKGVSFVGYWKSVLLTLDDRKIALTYSYDRPPEFQVSIKVVEVLEERDVRFTLRTGAKDFRMKAPSLEKKETFLATL